MGTLWVEIISFFCRKMNIWKQSRKAFTSPVNWNFYNKWLWESSLSVQCLGFGIFTAVDLIPSIGTEIPRAAWHGQINKCFVLFCFFNDMSFLSVPLMTLSKHWRVKYFQLILMCLVGVGWGTIPEQIWSKYRI